MLLSYGRESDAILLGFARQPDSNVFWILKRQDPTLIGPDPKLWGPVGGRTRY
jgi:hypothetical protein